MMTVIEVSRLTGVSIRALHYYAHIGLLPAALAAKARAIGNASLEGASRLLLSREEGEKARGIAARSRHVALGGNPMFNERYIENMMFESSDCD